MRPEIAPPKIPARFCSVVAFLFSLVLYSDRALPAAKARRRTAQRVPPTGGLSRTKAPRAAIIM